MEPNIQGQPMNPMDSNATTESVTQIDITEASVPATPVPEKKSSKGMLLGLIFCLILAAGGIGFGVWTMMDSSAQKTNYEKQISDLNSRINTLQEQAAKGDDEDKGDDADDVDPADYIYVGEWGLKIKKVDGLKIDKYSFVNIEDNNDFSRVEVYAGGEGDYPLGDVVRVDKEKEAVGLFNIVFSDDNYDYYTSGPNGDVPSDLVQELELVKKMISNSENYSEI